MIRPITSSVKPRDKVSPIKILMVNLLLLVPLGRAVLVL